MKAIFLVLGCCLQLSAMSQMKEGKVIYERKMNLHKRLQGGDESMKNMIPEFTTSKVQLIFSDAASIYKNLPEEEDIRESAGQSQDGPRIVMKFGGTDDETYKNYATGKSIEQRELGPRKYIIEDSLRKLSWKLEESATTREVKGFVCRKAVGKSAQGTEVVAWYTDQINCPSGPDVYGGLPGLILELNIGAGEIVFTAVEISDKMDIKSVKAPTNGKRITRKEFQKMVEEEFGASPGGGPVIKIHRVTTGQ